VPAVGCATGPDFESAVRGEKCTALAQTVGVNFKAPIGVSSQTAAGPTCDFWANPVGFRCEPWSRSRGRMTSRRRAQRRPTPSEQDAKWARKLGQLQPFLAVSPPECTGQLSSLGPTEYTSRSSSSTASARSIAVFPQGCVGQLASFGAWANLRLDRTPSPPQERRGPAARRRAPLRPRGGAGHRSPLDVEVILTPPLYSSLATLYTKHTVRRQNDANVHAYGRRLPRRRRWPTLRRPRPAPSPVTLVQAA
jgi:hypothetical protein